MAVGIRTKLAGVTAEQFDQVRAAVNPEGNPPEGLIFHASGPIDGGWGVIDFWESSEHHQRFVAERVMPAMARRRSDGRTRRSRIRSPRTLPALTIDARDPSGLGLRRSCKPSLPVVVSRETRHTVRESS